jgi:hypothetical protein
MFNKAMQKERKTISLEEKLNILLNVDKHAGTCILLMKQLGLSVSAEYDSQKPSCH